MPKCELVGLQDVFRYAVRLKDFDGGKFTYEEEDVGFKFPLSLECIALYDLNKTFFQFLLPIAYQLTELNLLHVSHLYRNNYYLLIRMCPNLEILYTHDIFDDKGMKLIGQCCKKMRKLNTGSEEIAPNRLTEKRIIALAQGCLELGSLHINVIDITNEAMECIGAHLKNLCDFHMILLKEDTETILPLDNGVRTMLIGCRKLEKLSIHLCPGGLTDAGFGYIGKYGHNLRYLSLCCVGECDAGLVELTKGCPKLKKLETKGCPFSEQALSTFVFNIYSLRYMWVLGDRDHNAWAMTRPNSI
ncbi:hypothetical protein CTI12_AA006240 [Artemisia annua]|uniref:COI1 F-box domain-containing protein n=1 Tax=Artemisia annua TaxID=35608 RepID=A0A2U1QNI7_ARTAN|nr:hypothetical protein CTI12_AA006240 [Artemisia annua]